MQKVNEKSHLSNARHFDLLKDVKHIKLIRGSIKFTLKLLKLRLVL